MSRTQKYCRRESSCRSVSHYTICFLRMAMHLRCYPSHAAHRRLKLPQRFPAGRCIHQRGQSLLTPLLSTRGDSTACLHGNEYRASTWRLMFASLVLLRAVVWHVSARLLSIAPPLGTCRPHCCCCFSRRCAACLHRSWVQHLRLVLCRRRVTRRFPRWCAACWHESSV